MRGARLAAVGLLLAAILAVPAAAGPLPRDLVEKARAYFDPAQELVWRPRKDLLQACEAARGKGWLKDLAFLRDLVYQGRHYLERFDDPAWRRDHDVTAFETTEDLYRSVRSEQWQFTWSLPARYPSEQALERIPRADPFPLLFVLGDEEDSRARYMGEAALAHRYPKEAWKRLYDHWLTLAPAAPLARFLEDDGSIRHRFATSVLTEFWRRYHVDYDRIVVDGGEAAAALAAAFPNVFAGLVLRGDARLDPDVVRNYANLPVFVADDASVARTLREMGHPGVTTGDAAALSLWLEKRRRVVARSFLWRMKRLDHQYPHWIRITAPDYAAPDRTLDVEVLDTPDDPNTVSITAAGIHEMTVHLNDEIVDLDREVRVVVNGREVLRQRFERDFDRVFDKDPYVRKNMNFGWLYPVRLEHVRVPGPLDETALEEQARRLSEGFDRAAREGNRVKARLYYFKLLEMGETPYAARARARLIEMGVDEDEVPTSLPREPPPGPPEEDAEPPVPGPPPDVRLAVTDEWIRGRLDLLEHHLGEADTIESPEALLPLALRDLWWRRADDPDLVHRVEDAADRAGGFLRDQLEWILGGGEDPYPHHEDPAYDPWPVLTSLVLERQQRESTGAAWLPDESPLLRRPVPDAWREGFGRYVKWFYDGFMRPAYEGESSVPTAEDEAQMSEEERQALERERAAEAALDARVAAGRSRNTWLAILLAALFVGVPVWLGRRLGRRP